MNKLEISKKGLFFFEWNWKQSAEVAGMFPFGEANAESDFLKIAESCLLMKHDFVFVVNDGMVRDFPSGLVTGIMLNAQSYLSVQTFLDWKNLLKCSQNQSDHYPSYNARSFGMYGNFFAGSLSEYEVDFQKFTEELSKVCKLTDSCGFVGAFFSPIATETEHAGSVNKLNVTSLVASCDLYNLKRAERFLRSQEHDTEEYFFQKEELLPVFAKISRLETKNLGSAPHLRSVQATKKQNQYNEN